MSFLKKAFDKPEPPGKREDDIEYPCPPGEPLSPDEIAFVKSIFGDELKTEGIKKFHAPEARPSPRGGTTCARAFGTTAVKFYGNDNKAADYRRTDDADLYGIFIHEITHLWQNANPESVSTKGFNYTYPFYPEAEFSHYGREQQASMIQDYARQFFYFKKTAGTGNYLPTVGAVDESSLRKLSDLQRVVEDRFPEARKTRLALSPANKPGRKWGSAP
jgi:hypothetical protein